MQPSSSWLTYFQLHDNVPTIQQLSSIEFDPFDWDDDSLVHGCGLMFQHVGALDAFGLRLDVLQHFLLEIKSKYRLLPYHNFKHGFAVMQFAFYVVTNTGMAQQHSQLELFALLVACLCHDVDHNGHTNLFEVASGSDLAIRYYDESVLENHHLSVAFEIMRKPESNFLHHENSNFKPEQVREVRKIMISCILATDMSHHAEMLNQLSCLLTDPNGSITSSRQFVWDVITHVADLSGQMLPWRIAQKWENGITTEFMEQAKQEEAGNLPLTSFMQNLDAPCMRYNRQLEYMDCILTPLLTCFGELFPPLKPSLLHNLKLNRQHYETLSKEGPFDSRSPQAPSALSIRRLHPPLSPSRPSDNHTLSYLSDSSSPSSPRDGNPDHIAIRFDQTINLSINQSLIDLACCQRLTIDTSQYESDQPLIESLPHAAHHAGKFEPLEEKSLDYTLSERNNSINHSVPAILDASETVRRFRQESEQAIVSI